MFHKAEETKHAILKSAETEFLQYGFANASLRRIASGAGVTTGALYRYFTDKNALFDALVLPAYTGLLEQYRLEGEGQIAQLQQEGMSPMWEASGHTYKQFVEYIYDHYSAFRLLISGSEQSPYEHFTHTLVDMDVDITLQYLALARKLGLPVNEVSREELHIIANAQFSCLYEMVLHQHSRQDALRMTDKIVCFFSAGWQALLLA